MLASPKVDVDGVEYGQQGEAPGDGVDDGCLSTGEELVDDGSKEQGVDEGPNEECPWSW
ncbi:hypothetical protein E4U54_007147, partial [Claviceps lovelessii]